MKSITRNLAIYGLALGLGLPTMAFADSASNASKANGPTTVDKDDINFFEKSAQTDMTELQAAQIAQSRSLSAGTKSFATMMTSDHTKNSDDLRALASNKGVTLPTQLDSKHQGELDDLQKIDAKKFDAAYAKAMAKGHKDAVDLYEKVSKKSKDADIRQFATGKLPTLQHHLSMAKDLEKKGD